MWQLQLRLSSKRKKQPGVNDFALAYADWINTQPILIPILLYFAQFYETATT